MLGAMQSLNRLSTALVLVSACCTGWSGQTCCWMGACVSCQQASSWATVSCGNACVKMHVKRELHETHVM